MIERLEVTAEWSDRQESLDQCAVRATDYFQRLILVDEIYSHWFLKGRSRAEALSKPVTLSSASLRTLLYDGRHRRQLDRVLIESLGFQWALWNGMDDPFNISVDGRCGAFPELNGMPFANQCKLDLPFEGPGAIRLLQPIKLQELLSIAVDCWDPEYAHVSSFHMSEAIGSTKSRTGDVGWITYVSDRFYALPDLPAEYQVARKEHGTMITMRGIDHYTAENETHRALSSQLLEIVQHARR